MRAMLQARHHVLLSVIDNLLSSLKSKEWYRYERGVLGRSYRAQVDI